MLLSLLVLVPGVVVLPTAVRSRLDKLAQLNICVVLDDSEWGFWAVIVNRDNSAQNADTKREVCSDK